MNIYNQSYDLATTPTGRNKNFGLYKTHNKHDILAKILRSLVLLIGNSIVASLSRYQTVWKKYFEPYKALNCGISGDRTWNFLRSVEALSVSPSVEYVLVHCGTHNLDLDEPKTFVNGIIKIGKLFQEKLAADLKII